MKQQIKRIALALTMVSAFAAAGSAFASGAYITNGVITMGVNELGALNVNGGTGVYPGASMGGTGTVGLRYLNPADGLSYASTEPGCTCEGWGAAVVSTGDTGYQNTSSGTGGLSLVSFTSTASTATSVTRVGSSLEVTHEYRPAGTNVYQVAVTIKNISGADLAAGDVRYRRVMDWDIEPTPFSEYVTIHGVPGSGLGIANGSNLLHTGDNGFASADPLAGDSLSISCAANADFTDCGPSDHGALFDFEFGALLAGAQVTFSTYYGAAGNEAGALAALSSVGAGIYSLGQSNGAPGAGTPVTFFFGFGGASGVLTPTPEVPEPASLALAALGLAAVAGRRMRRKA